MKKLTLITAAFLIGCIAVACIGQERVCTPSGCYFVPAKPQSARMVSSVIPQSVPVLEQSIVVESSEVVVSQSLRQPLRQPLRKVFSGRPVRGLLKRVFCR